MHVSFVMILTSLIIISGIIVRIIFLVEFAQHYNTDDRCFIYIHAGDALSTPSVILFLIGYSIQCKTLLVGYTFRTLFEEIWWRFKTEIMLYTLYIINYIFVLSQENNGDYKPAIGEIIYYPFSWIVRISFNRIDLLIADKHVHLVIMLLVAIVIYINAKIVYDICNLPILIEYCLQFSELLLTVLSVNVIQFIWTKLTKYKVDALNPQYPTFV